MGWSGKKYQIYSISRGPINKIYYLFVGGFPYKKKKQNEDIQDKVWIEQEKGNLWVNNYKKIDTS